MDVKTMAIMLLSVAIWKGATTEDDAMKILLSMDVSADGSDEELDQRAHAVVPIMNNLTKRYETEGQGL